MTFASFLLGLLIASIPACAFNFLIAGKLKKLILLNIFSWVGFWIGQLTATWRGWTFLKVGPIILGVDLLFAIFFIAAGFWLTNLQPVKNNNHR
ncbi:MAG: hypothetical protein AB9897_08160 [Anaerolineaceae bacterium]